MKTKQTGARGNELGDRAWQVCWTTDVPLDENGDSLIDMGKDCTKTFRTEEAARKFSRKLLDEEIDYFGCPMIYPVEWTDPYEEGFVSTFRWEAIGDGYSIADEE